MLLCWVAFSVMATANAQRQSVPIPTEEATVSFGHLEAKYLAPGLPVIVKAAAASWPASKWTVEHLDQVCGSAPAHQPCTTPPMIIGKDQIPRSLNVSHLSNFSQILALQVFCRCLCTVLLHCVWAVLLLTLVGCCVAQTTWDLFV